MKKEEILEKSRNENKKKDVYEIEVESKACKIASIAMVILACIYYCVDLFKGNGQNYGFYSIITIYCTILYGYKAIFVEKNRVLCAIASIIWGILTIGLILDQLGII